MTYPGPDLEIPLAGRLVLLGAFAFLTAAVLTVSLLTVTVLGVDRAIDAHRKARR